MQAEKRGNLYYIKNMYYEQLSKLSPMYVLDSNVVADLEYFYYSPQKMNKEKKKEIIELLLGLKGNRIKYDYALIELSSNYLNGEIIIDRYNHTKEALKKLLKMSAKQLRSHEATMLSVDYNILHQQKNDFGIPSKVIINSLPLLSLSFTPLTKLFYEIKTNKDKIKQFSNFINYLNDELNMVSMYEVSFATFLLFSGQDELELKYVQSLLKINNKMDATKKIWNVSWDMTFLRYINDLAGRIVSGEIIDAKVNYVLVTQDKALGEIASLIKTDNNFDFNGKAVPNLIIDETKIKDIYYKEYMKIYNKIMSQFDERRDQLSKFDSEIYIKEILLRKADELLELLVS